MKVCPVCKSAVPDDAEYCETCGNDEFFDGGYPQQFEQPYQDGYSQPPQYDYNQQYQPQQPQYDYNPQYQQQPQYDYNPQYQQQPQYDYNPQYQQQPQYDYNQQYQQPQQYGYNQNQYQQQPQQPQYDYNPQYQQQPQQPQYDYNPQYQQQPQQPQYDYNPQYQQQPQYQEQYEQPVEEQQQTVTEEPVYEEVQPAEIQPAEEEQPAEEQPVEEEQPAEEQPVEEEQPAEEQPVEEEQPAEPEEPKENPYEVSKNFVFEKKETAEQAQPETKEKPKNIKGYINMFMNTKDHTIEFDKADAEKNRKNAIIASLGITFWVPFIMKDYSRYARYYGNQGLLTLILMIPCTILYSLITGVVVCNACTAAVYQNGVAAFRYLTFGGWIAAIIFFAICYAIPLFVIYCSVTNIKQGKAKDIPFIGALRLIS